VHNKCIFCSFEGQGFEKIIRNLKGESSNGTLNENMIQVIVLLKCPKCDGQRKFTYGYSTDDKIGDKISNNENKHGYLE